MHVWYQEFYHKSLSLRHNSPKIFGMTASLVDGRGSNNVEYSFHELETNLGSTIMTVKNREVIEQYTAKVSENLICYANSHVLERIPTAVRCVLDFVLKLKIRELKCSKVTVLSPIRLKSC